MARANVTARFRSSWNSVRCYAIPGGDHRINALIQRFCAQIGAPREGGDDDIGGVVCRRVNAHANIPDKHQRTDIGAGQIIFADHRAARRAGELCSGP